jgi:UDP-N-acetylenolpyruvoylglucosamine reductase
LHRQEVAQVNAKLRNCGQAKSSQPSGFPNSGSMFRNPPGDFAGIDRSGWQAIASAKLRSPRASQLYRQSRRRQAADVRQLMEAAQSECAGALISNWFLKCFVGGVADRVLKRNAIETLS